MQPSDRAGGHPMMDVIRLADRQRDDRQGRIARPGARELTAITDEQVLDVVRLTPPVANSIRPVGAHPARAHVVAVGKRRAPYDVFRISGARKIVSTVLRACFSIATSFGVLT